MHLLGKTAHIVMALDYVGRVATDRHALDDVRIKRALRQKPVLWSRSCGRGTDVFEVHRLTMASPSFGRLKADVTLVFSQQLLSRMLENVNEFVADNFSFLFRINNVAKLRQEPLAGVDV